MKTLLLSLAAIAVFALGCPNEAADVEGGAASHAASVKLGSHADWCDDHAVPESQCTRCHPELAVAFQATKDWCEEHGVPESHCLKCHPELKIVRPAKVQ